MAIDFRKLQHRNDALSRWISAHDDAMCWTYGAEQHYQYLLDTAGELYQLGIVAMHLRHELVTLAHDTYQHQVERNHMAREQFSHGYVYEVIEQGALAGHILSEGHYYSIDRQELRGYIPFGPNLQGEIEFTRHPDVLGIVVGLEIRQPGRQPLTLRQITPPGFQFRDWRIS